MSLGPPRMPTRRPLSGVQPGMAIVRPLAQVGAADIDAVGGKAANLGELLRANFPVPDGFVLTTDAYAAAAQAARVDPGQPARAAEQLRACDVPEAVAKQPARRMRS